MIKAPLLSSRVAKRNVHPLRLHLPQPDTAPAVPTGAISPPTTRGAVPPRVRQKPDQRRPRAVVLRPVPPQRPRLSAEVELAETGPHGPQHKPLLVSRPGRVPLLMEPLRHVWSPPVLLQQLDRGTPSSELSQRQLGRINRLELPQAELFQSPCQPLRPAVENLPN